MATALARSTSPLERIGQAQNPCRVNQLSVEKRAAVLAEMVESKSLRAISRNQKGNARRSSSDSRNRPVALNTVYKLLADAGDTAIAFLNDKLRDLPCTRVEADEVYAWVGMHPERVRRRKITSDLIGVFWIWIALDRVSKLVIHWHVGRRGRRDARIFIAGLKARLRRKRQPNGTITPRIQLTTDSLKGYRKAVEKEFGADIDYAMVKKRDAEEERLRNELGVKAFLQLKRQRKEQQQEKLPPEIICGEPDLTLATTNHIESFFQKFRQNLRRMVRKTTGYSKSVTNLRRAVALYIFRYNFCRLHSSLRVPSGKRGGKQHYSLTTPAIAAGIDDNQWEWEHFLDLVDEVLALRRREASEKRQQAWQLIPYAPPRVPARARPTAMPTTKPSGDYLVYLSPSGDYSKLHDFRTCRHTRFDPDNPKQQGRFGFCETLDEARALGERLTPGYVEECKFCLGEFNCLGYVDPSWRTRGDRN